MLRETAEHYRHILTFKRTSSDLCKEVEFNSGFKVIAISDYWKIKRTYEITEDFVLINHSVFVLRLGD